MSAEEKIKRKKGVGGWEIIYSLEIWHYFQITHLRGLCNVLKRPIIKL
jgi:hypothetical protein